MANYSFIAGEDLTNKRGYAIKGDPTGVKVQTSANGGCLGILMNDNVAGGAVGIALNGQITKAKLGGTVAQGDLLSTDASGKFVKATTGDIVAQALEAGDSDDLVYAVVTIGKFGAGA